MMFDFRKETTRQAVPAVDTGSHMSRRGALTLGMMSASVLALAPEWIGASPASAAAPLGSLRPDALGEVTFFRQGFSKKVVWHVAQTLMIAEATPVAALQITVTADTRVLEHSERLVAASSTGVRSVFSSSESTSGPSKSVSFGMASLDTIVGPIDVRIPLRAKRSYPDDLVEDAIQPSIDVTVTEVDGSVHSTSMPLTLEALEEDVAPHALAVFGAWWSVATSSDLLRAYRAPTSLSLVNAGPFSSPRVSIELISDAGFSGEPVLFDDVGSAGPAVAHTYEGHLRRSSAVMPEIGVGEAVTFSVEWGEVVLDSGASGAIPSQLRLVAVEDTSMPNRVSPDSLSLIDQTPTEALAGLTDVARTELG